jgi:hypothetical protein
VFWGPKLKPTVIQVHATHCHAAAIDQHQFIVHASIEVRESRAPIQRMILPDLYAFGLQVLYLRGGQPVTKAVDQQTNTYPATTSRSHFGQ